MNAERVSIFQGKKVDTRALDLFVERLLSEDSHFVVDNGASSFVPVSHYLLENVSRASSDAHDGSAREMAFPHCLYALQATIPRLTRSLHRCLKRHGIARLPDGDRSGSGAKEAATLKRYRAAKVFEK
jgi:hypothetical protein